MSAPAGSGSIDYTVGLLPPHLDAAAARLFGDQFVDDPTWVAIGPRWRGWRRRIARWSFRAEVWLARRFDGIVIATVIEDRPVAVTVIWPHSPPALPWWGWLVRAAPIVPGGPIAGWRATQVTMAYDRHHPHEPHGSPWVSAADPTYKGAMHQVWVESLKRLDAMGQPTYIEASRPQYEALYNHYGYETVHRIRLRTGAEILGMWRPVGAGEFADLPVRRRS